MEVLDEINLPEKPEYAGFGIRFAAYLLDWIFIGLVEWILGLLLGIHIFSESMDVIWFGNLLSLLYFILLEAGPQQGTFGKQIAGIKVVTAAGERMTLGQSAIRNLSKILSAIILLIGFIMVAFTEKKQGLHDLIANTFVVRGN